MIAILWANMFFQCHVVAKVFQNLLMRLKFIIGWVIKINIFVGCEIQFFQILIFSFTSYVYYQTRGFIAPTCAFNLLSHAFNLPTHSFNLATRAFNLATRAISLLTRELELVTREFELVTRALLFHFFIE